MKALCRQQRGSCGSERVPTNLYVHLYTRALSNVNSVSRHTALTGDTNYSSPLQAGHSIDVHGVCITSLPRVSQSYTASSDGARDETRARLPARLARQAWFRLACLLTATLAFNWHQQCRRTIHHPLIPVSTKMHAAWVSARVEFNSSTDNRWTTGKLKTRRFLSSIWVEQCLENNF